MRQATSQAVMNGLTLPPHVAPEEGKTRTPAQERERTPQETVRKWVSPSTECRRQRRRREPKLKRRLQQSESDGGPARRMSQAALPRWPVPRGSSARREP